MKNKALTVSLFALVALLIGAVLLYKNLSGSYAPEQLSTLGTTAAPESTPETVPEESLPDSTGATQTLSPEYSDTHSARAPNLKALKFLLLRILPSMTWKELPISSPTSVGSLWF